jgi:glycosyltransferase involved in cell wall biosynthesis
MFLRWPWVQRRGVLRSKTLMPEPQVTVVIPCFNHGRFVEDAVRSCLDQEGADVRVVVVNDGSDDGKTPKACDACHAFAPDRVVVVHQENRGLPAARNRGAQEAAGEYLVFLDADDWIRPGFISKLAAAIEADENIDGVSHAYCQEELAELGTGIWRVPEWDPELLLITNLHPVTALVRRDRFDAVGGFDESMTGGYEDWELWLKLSERGWRGVRVPEPLFVWRRHSHETMIMDAVKRHESLFRALVERHHDLYTGNMESICVRMNVLMRKFDVNWIDETGYPIPLRALWGLRDEVAQARSETDAVRDEMQRARDEIDVTRRELDIARGELSAANAEAARIREFYESWVAVRLHHAIHRVVRALGPLGRPIRAVMNLVRSVLPRGARQR